MKVIEQTLLFPPTEADRRPQAVNVASVPQRSPFRYPGGKTWFVPTFRKWIRNMTIRPRVLIEPFVGGGIISLTALFENYVEQVIMIDKDEEITAVWKSVVAGNADWLADRVLEFDLTRENVIHEINKKYTDIKHIAFQTILKNRTLHGGILADGSGFIKHGENGKGILSRWYPQTIAARLRNLNYIANRITCITGDGLEVLKDHASDHDAIFFIDPPYTAGGKKAGRRLYKYYELDHEMLFHICKTLKGDFLMTYDVSGEVGKLSDKHGFATRQIPMKNTHHADMMELVIGRDLSWME
jgi:DNA adenine methylase